MPTIEDGKFQEMMRREMAAYSPHFASAVAALSRGDIDAAVSSFEASWRCAEANAVREDGRLTVSREWIDAFCGTMFCAMSAGYYSDVVQMDKKLTSWVMGGTPTCATGEPIVLRDPLPSR
ncbi:MAG: hypothetical protein GXX92_12755, partial [Clostridiales bacterium]|nr:hypothetical protein [Clostridiales bacterium]